MSDMASGDSIVRGLKAVARHFGMSLRQVQRWVRDPRFPKLSGRRFDLHQVQAWLDQRQGISPAPPPGHRVDPNQPNLPDGRGKDFQDERQKRLKGDLLEMEVRQRRGELVERAEVEQLFVARILACKQGLVSPARSLPPLLPTPPEARREAEAIITARVRELLEEFARPLPKKLGQGEATKRNLAAGAPDSPGGEQGPLV